MKLLTIGCLLSALSVATCAAPPISLQTDEVAGKDNRAQLLVQVLDEARKPLRLRYRKAPGEAEHWPSEPTILILPVPQDLPPFRSELVRAAKTTNDHGLAFEFLTGREYWVTLLAPGHAAQSVRVSMRAGSEPVEQTFTLRSPAQPGAILLDVVDAKGVPLTKNVSVRILDPVTGVALLSTRESSRSFVLDEWPARLSLPAGEYVIEVVGAASSESRHGTLVAPRLWGDYRAEVLVAPGQVTHVAARLNSPAWIQLDLKGQIARSDRDAALRNNSWLSEAVEPQYLERRLAEFAQCARVQLWREGDYPILVPFARKDVGGSTPGYLRLHDSLIPGTKQKSQALAPGTFELRVTLPGGRKSSKKAELVAGEVLEIEVDLGF